MENGRRADARTSTLTLNIAAFRELCRKHGLHNDRAVAKALGVRHSTVWRNNNGLTGPSERFIAGVLYAFPEAKFEDLFRVVAYNVKH